MILQCGSPDCRKWQHVKCIAEDAVLKAGESMLHVAISQSGSNRVTAGEAPATKKARPKHVSIGANSLAQAKSQVGSFTAEVLIKDLPSGEGQTAAENSEIIVTDAEGAKHSQPLSCLFCGKEIE